ncbi:MAG TPA: hypothetical protein VFX35_01430 [Solirubrobacterales bacterium]|nr:hypothetical protein [Solirubrobacterales bacterium]
MPSTRLRRELLGFAGCLAFLVIAAYAIGLITSSLATLGIDWYWWFGLGLMILTVTVPRWGRSEPSPPFQSPREEIDLANERYEFESRRDSYLENRMLRRVA